MTSDDLGRGVSAHQSWFQVGLCYGRVIKLPDPNLFEDASALCVN